MPIFAFAGVEAALEHMLPRRGQGQLQHFAHGLRLAVSAIDEFEDAAERPKARESSERDKEPQRQGKRERDTEHLEGDA